LESLFAVVLCLFAGLVLRRVAAFPREAAVTALNAFAIYVALPALVVRQVAAMHLSGDALLPVVAPWIVLASSAGLVVLAARAFAWSRPVTGALLLVVPLGNTAFLGLPLTSALLGPEALPYAVLYDQLGSFLALTIYGSYIAGTFGAGARVDARAVARRVLVFPPFVALVVGVALAVLLPQGLPRVVDGALALVAASLVPAVLVAVGLGWRLVLPRGARAPFGLALALKLVVAPAGVALMVLLVGATGPAAEATVLQAAMGPMVTAGALAIAADLAPELVAAIVGYGTLLSLATVPLVKLALIG